MNLTPAGPLPSFFNHTPTKDTNFTGIEARQPGSSGLSNFITHFRQLLLRGRFSFLLQVGWGDWLSVFFTVIGFGAVVGGAVSLVVYSQQPVSGLDDLNESGVELPKLGILTVSVTGAVAHPGLYSLQEGDRIAQALEAAGGVLPAADAQQLSSLNLAQKVTDEYQLNIEFSQPEVLQGPNSNSDGSTASTATTLININTASQKELETLPGIGAVRAAAIIENRPYSSPEDLVTKEVVTPTMMKNLETLISS